MVEYSIGRKHFLVLFRIYEHDYDAVAVPVTISMFRNRSAEVLQLCRVKRHSLQRVRLQDLIILKASVTNTMTRWSGQFHISPAP